MQLKEYIDKNLPNLNWNILPQIFEDEGIELTEEIKAYLKETPGNTNWNVFEGIVKTAEGGEDVVLKDIVFDADVTFDIAENTYISTSSLIQNPVPLSHAVSSDDPLQITIGNTTWDGINDGNDSHTYWYGEAGVMDVRFGYDANRDIVSLNSIADYTKTEIGTYHVTVEVLPVN